MRPNDRPNPTEIDRDAIIRLIAETVKNVGGVQRLATAAGINVSNLHSYRHDRVPGRVRRTQTQRWPTPR